MRKAAPLGQIYIRGLRDTVQLPVRGAPRQRCYRSMGYTTLASCPVRHELALLVVHLSSPGRSSYVTDSVLIYGLAEESE